MNQLLETILEKDKEEAEFDAIFRPATAEELEARAARFVEEALEEALKKGKCTQNPDGTWSCKDDVDLHNLNLKKLPVKFKRVEGIFNCSKNKLTSLEGAPEHVGEDFNCYKNQLRTLEGAPEQVGGYFYCYGNQLTSLEGAPKKVGGNFDCEYNQLKTLEGVPKRVDGVLVEVLVVLITNFKP